MHEMGVAAEIRRIARESVAGRGEGRITCVRLAVGDLAAVEPEVLGYAWEALVQGTPEEGAVLEVDWRPARQTCPRCGDMPGRAPGSWLRLCPRCGDILRVTGGDDLDVLQVVFEEAEPAGRAAAGEMR
jgi:hydrogenase nickel incorporation protein HypA/HybF